MVKDINPGTGSSNPQGLINFNGVLFFSADDGTNGRELWRSDGTDAGTYMSLDINAGSASSNPSNFTVVGTKLFFAAEDAATGRELWSTDGTVFTNRVKDIWPGSASSNPAYLTNGNGTLYFVANNGIVGRELWKSDGTAGGTTLVVDLHGGPPSSDPFFLTYVNNTLFFSADDGVDGEDFRVAGAVIHRLKNCYLFDMEAKRLEELFRRRGIPPLQIESDYESPTPAALITRVEAFLEVVRQNSGAAC